MDKYTEEQIKDYSKKAKERVSKEYTWNKIIKEYEDLFMK